MSGKHSVARHVITWQDTINKTIALMDETVESLPEAQDVLYSYDDFVLWLRDYIMDSCDSDEFSEMRPKIEELVTFVRALMARVEYAQFCIAAEQTSMISTESVDMQNWMHTRLMARLPIQERKADENDVTSILELAQKYPVAA